MTTTDTFTKTAQGGWIDFQPVAVQDFAGNEEHWADKVIVTMDPARAYVTETPPLSAQLFEDAIEHIRIHGWGKGNNVNEHGQVCTQGALGLWRVKNVPVTNWAGVAYATAELHDEARFLIINRRQIEVMDLMGIGSHWGSIVAWNDHPTRTREHVIDALTLAAKTLRDQGR